MTVGKGFLSVHDRLRAPRAEYLDERTYPQPTIENRAELDGLIVEAILHPGTWSQLPTHPTFRQDWKPL